MLQESLFTFRSGVGFMLAATAALVILTMPLFRSMKYRTLLAVATGLLAFQAFHFLEHLVQLSYWFMHPDATPYMTPWAMSGAEGLGLWATILPGAGAAMMRGMELLHLVGNFLFLGGLLALAHVARRAEPEMHLRGLRAATAVQWVHVAEHVLLTGSVFLVGEPLGVSTLFGWANGAAWGGSARVWFHFLINLAATVPAVVAYSSYLDELAHRNAVRELQPAHAEGLAGAVV